MDFGAVSWVGAALGAVAFFALGGLWYGPLFSDRWMAATGMTEEQARASNLPLIFGGTLVLEFGAAVGLAALIGAEASVATGAWTGTVVGVLIVLAALAVNALYERRPPVLLALNGGYNVLGFIAMGAIIGWLQ